MGGGRNFRIDKAFFKCFNENNPGIDNTCFAISGSTNINNKRTSGNISSLIQYFKVRTVQTCGKNLEQGEKP
jgi:hypothetical protein